MRQIAAFFVFAALATPALAQDLPAATGFYIQAYGGLRVPDNLQLDGAALDLGFGTTFGVGAGVVTSLPGLSVGADYMRSSASYDALGTTLDSWSLMAEAQYAPSLNLNLGVQPYVGAGLGAVNVTYKSDSSAFAPAFELKAGVSGPITGQLSWFGEYRYQQAIGMVDTPGHDVEYASHSIVGGLRFSFDGPSSAASSYTGAGNAGYGY